MSFLRSTYVNNIACEVPENEVHEVFIQEAPQLFLTDEKDRKLFARLAKKNQVDFRYSVISPEGTIPGRRLGRFFDKECFPSTDRRMAEYEKSAFPLVSKTLRRLREREDLSGVSHVIVTSCTGFYAPGVDLEIIRELGLKNGVSRTIIGFMGCQAAFNGLRMADQAVKADPRARVLMVNVELCTLHLKDRSDLEGIVPYMIFADGCAASLISAEERGLRLKTFDSFLDLSESGSIRWEIGDQGFDMFLSLDLPKKLERIFSREGKFLLKERPVDDFALWAVHPGGRGIIDAVQNGLEVVPEKMNFSREVLRRFGNMSSATIMFVLRDILFDPAAQGEGFAVGFGPGLSAETLIFHKALM